MKNYITKMSLKSILLATAVTFSSSHAFAETKLFKEWEFNDPISDFSSQQGFYDCTADMGTSARCIDDISFLNETYGASLVFNNDRLATVIVVSDYDEQRLVNIMGALRRNFTMVMLEGMESRFDIIERVSQGVSQEAFMAQLSEYEASQLGNGYLSYAFLEQPKNEIRGSSNAVEAVMSAPEDARSAEVIVSENEWGTTTAIKFALPVRAMKQLQQSAEQAPQEDF